MKKVAKGMILIIIISILFLMVFAKHINFPSILRSLEINFAKTKDISGNCPNLNAGFYDITSHSNNNNFDGLTIQEGVTYKNINSKKINSTSVCYGYYTFTPTKLQEVKYLGQEEIKLDPGEYTIGENISQGTYKISTTLNKNETLYIYKETKKNNTVMTDFKEAKAGEELIFTLEDKDKIKVYSYKNNVLGTDEVLNKQITFTKQN